MAPDGHVELRWIDGGHAWAFLNVQEHFLLACVKAIDEAEPVWKQRFACRHLGGGGASARLMWSS